MSAPDQPIPREKQLWLGDEFFELRDEGVVVSRKRKIVLSRVRLDERSCAMLDRDVEQAMRNSGGKAWCFLFDELPSIDVREGVLRKILKKIEAR